MFNKKEVRRLLIGSIASFFLIAFFAYMFYMNTKPKIAKLEPPTTDYMEDSEEETQMIMATNVDKIKAGTNVVFEIVDQFGMVTQTNMYPGVNWMDATRTTIGSLYPDYVITNFKEDQVVLTRVIERQVEPDYVLTRQEEHIVIAIRRNGHNVFYKDTGLEQHDFSDKLAKALEKGISITIQQKDDILKDAEEIYIILQEYDE
ncbi:MAG TPA: hypothetical protein GX707_00195 [Epulopiscium sp.]|nr:hypothetical protein [Candidatus Epulonipiscium sp.]